MLGNHVIIPFHIPGTLAANVNIRWKAPFDLTVKKISAVASNDSDATMTVGVSTDTDSLIEATTIGDSNVPTEFTRSNFGANAYGNIAEGDILVITVDYDGSSGTAAADLTVVITALEG